MGFIDFTNGEVLTADQMDTVMRQGIMRFADASARDTALSAVLAEGMMAYLDDTDEVLKYDGSQWIDISGDITGVTAGTALTGGGTSGDVTLDVDTAAVGSAIGIDTKQDDVITTQGDLVIGDASGDAFRIGIGAADTVLTSNGATAVWGQVSGGGGELVFEAEPNKITQIDNEMTAGITYEIAMPDGNVIARFVDATGQAVEILQGPGNVTPSSDVVSIELTNDTSSAKFVSRTNPVLEPSDALADFIAISATQSITLTKSFEAVLVGGGGAGGGNQFANSGGGGGGSGFISFGTLTAGTYTATIGAGGTGVVAGDGNSGGTTSIGSLSALGGNGGKYNPVNDNTGGDGGDGGSGGGAGTGNQGFTQPDIPGGFNGSDGTAFGAGNDGAVGLGSAVLQGRLGNVFPSVVDGAYAGGAGGYAFPAGGGSTPAAANSFGEGGDGAIQGDRDDNNAGADGAAGVIILVESSI